MALSKSPYRGPRDFFPKEMRLRNYIFQKMAQVSETFAYEPYDGPLLEEVELYLAKSGEELITDQIYSFIDRGDRKVAIRPEMTPTVARMVAQIHREVAKPLRWYAIPNLMRYEKPQKGRLREFWQYNADIFGAAEYGEVEIIQLAVSIMKSFGATQDHFEILLNDRRLVDFVFVKLISLESEANKKLYKLVDRKNKMDPAKFSAEVRLITTEERQAQIFEEYVSITTVKELEGFVKKHLNLAEKIDFLLDEPASAHHEAISLSIKPLFDLFKRLEHLGLSSFVKFDPSIVRGLDYYTGVVFEIFDKHPENRRAIAGGGAYANLLQIFNELPLGGVGFGMGEVPLKDFLEAHKLMPDFTKPDFDVLVAYTHLSSEPSGFQIADALRSLGLKTEVIFGESKPKKVYGQTEKKNYHTVILLNENEVQVKHLKSQVSTSYQLNEAFKIAHEVKGQL